jgi:hypothetical protein
MLHPQNQRLTRWSMELLTYPRSLIEHIEGVQNEWADLMRRWGAKVHEVDDHQGELPVLRIQVNKDHLERYRVQPLLHLECLSLVEIRKAQASLHVSVKTRSHLDPETDLCYDNDRVIIPSQCKDLRLRLVVISHAGGRGGHFGQSLTLQ